MWYNTWTPCRDCERRYPGCHAECPEYKKFDEANRKRREEATKASKLSYGVRTSYRPKFKKNKKGGGSGWIR